jgi:hypothetical protein
MNGPGALTSPRLRSLPVIIQTAVCYALLSSFICCGPRPNLTAQVPQPTSSRSQSHVMACACARRRRRHRCAGFSFASAVNFTCARGLTEEDFRFLRHGVRRQFFQQENPLNSRQGKPLASTAAGRRRSGATHRGGFAFFFLFTSSLENGGSNRVVLCH